MEKRKEKIILFLVVNNVIASWRSQHQPSRMLTARANKSGFEDILEMFFGMGKMKKKSAKGSQIIWKKFYCFEMIYRLVDDKFQVPSHGKFHQKDKFVFKASLSQYWSLNYSNRSILEVILIDNRRHGNDYYLQLFFWWHVC